MLDVLEEEFLIYQAMVVDTDIPFKVWKESKCSTNESKSYRMDMVWNYLRKEWPQLSSIALFLLTSPCSNAAEERIYSMIAKNNKTSL